jgi:hypothetical protein
MASGPLFDKTDREATGLRPKSGWIDPLDAGASTHPQLGSRNPFCDCGWVDCPGPVKIGPVTHACGVSAHQRRVRLLSMGNQPGNYFIRRGCESPQVLGDGSQNKLYRVPRGRRRMAAAWFDCDRVRTPESARSARAATWPRGRRACNTPRHCDPLPPLRGHFVLDLINNSLRNGSLTRYDGDPRSWA